MDLIVVSSLDALCRQEACEGLAASHPGSAVVFYDLLENGRVIRRVYNSTGVMDRDETLLEHGCLSCAVRLDLAPSLERLIQAGQGPVIVGLPPAVPAAAAVSALSHGLRSEARVSSVIVACAPDAMEDHIRDAHTLFESGFTPVPDDERTAGEFLLGELVFADTVLLAEPEIVPSDPAGRDRGLHLIRELAPHAAIASDAAAVHHGSHHYAEAVQRTVPGTFQPHRTAAAATGSPFITVSQQVERPLHPGRFRQALGTLAASCCVLRGQLWMASAPECRIAIQGIGNRVWLENVGKWPESYLNGKHEGQATSPAAATVIIATGEDLDPAGFERLLRNCELTDDELASGEDLHDPFGLDTAR
ncbi:GTPase [Pseudarthrobacter sp. NamE2]|uniref:GTP-binding protein n=1 Tax=Pseudarthrobacter sp. NamE2 TaxID=2576838 RepID=UPI0010FDA1BA|nr:GTP-binding protein [Pseudarthrobacter sp. NamE2]TLM83320.1 GTPase [Pseudarthrobacter sp. NamE2]